MNIRPKRHVRMLAEHGSNKNGSSDRDGLGPPSTTDHQPSPSSRSSDVSLSGGHVAESNLKLYTHVRRVSALLSAISMLVVLFAVNTPLIQQLPSIDRAAVNWIVFAGGVLVAGILLFPWHRYSRNLLLIPCLIGISLIALIVYFSGGWSSPFSVFYLLVVVFCAVYFPPRLAALCVGLTLLTNLSPQLYTPDVQQLIEHLVVGAPVYLTLAFISRYMVREHVYWEHRSSSRRIRELQDHFQRESSIDHLTNVYNRAYFETRLREELERVWRLGGNFVLIFLDLDDFKQINDNYGHRMGDEALKLVARTLRSNTRWIDVVARYAGDEFVVLMPGVSLPGARSFFERFRKEVAEQSRFTLGFPIRLSAGAISCPRYASGPQGLLDAADDAMYRAKRRGKDQMFVALSLTSGEDRQEAGLEEG